MLKRRAARVVAFGGVAGALIGAAMLGGGCGSSSNNGGTGTGTGTNTATGSSSAGTGTGTGMSTSTSTGSASASTSTSTGASSSAADAGDAGPAAACNTLQMLLGDAGVSLFYSFDDGGLSGVVDGVTATWNASVDSDPADAGLTPVAAGNTTVGDTCPGSLEVTVPFTTVGQGARTALQFPYPVGTAVTGSTLHFALKYVIENPPDAAAATADLFSINGANSFLQAYAQYQFPLADGGSPDAAFTAPFAGQNHVTFGYTDFPSDGGWLVESLPLTGADGGAFTTPETVYLDQIYIRFLDPQQSDAGPAPLPFPLTVQFFVDDVYLQ